MRCPNCQMNINDDSKFCIHCGKSFNQVAEQNIYNNANQVTEQIVNNNSVDNKSTLNMSKLVVKIITTVCLILFTIYGPKYLFFYLIGNFAKDNFILIFPAIYIFGFLFYVVPSILTFLSITDLVTYIVKNNKNNQIVKNVVIAGFVIVFIALIYVVIKYYMFF